MIYDKKNKVLQGETIIISELSGDVFLDISAQDVDVNTAYYVEILCPKNLKYCLERCAFDNNVLSVKIPNTVLKDRGDIYAQVVCRNAETGAILDKSLVTALPIITVTRAINASDTVNEKAAFDVVSEMIKAKDNMEAVAVELREDILDKVGWTEVSIEFDKVNKLIDKIDNILLCDNIALDTLQKSANMMLYCKRKIEYDIYNDLLLLNMNVDKSLDNFNKWRIGEVVLFDYTNVKMTNIDDKDYMDSVVKMDAKYGGLWEVYTGQMAPVPPVGSTKMYAYNRIL